MIKKIKSALILSAIMGSVISYGEVSISFSTVSSTIKDHNLVNIAVGQTFLVYWSSDQSTSGFNSADPLNPTGDTVLGAFNITGGTAVGGRITGHSPEVFGAGTTLYSPGYVYIAVFELPFSGYAGSIAAGTYYGLGPIYTSSLKQQYPDPAAVDNYGGIITAVSPITTSLQVVPEPSTVALMLAGLGVLGFSRIRRK